MPTYRGGQGFFIGPLTQFARAKSGLVDACTMCPLCNAKSVAMQGKHMICPSITALVNGSAPDTVVRAVAVHIPHPFHGILRTWPWSHIGKEGFKGVLPPWAYVDVLRQLKQADSWEDIPQEFKVQVLEGVPVGWTSYPVQGTVIVPT